ncbi:RraA family protein [Janthinobacterium sp. J1-1]|uniref:RraA family protein n=1 Tax=Janthinobacterium sp. J1-1 TaxID=3065910 RepID=UPI0028114C97|nr:RraA family protein [Janthinobacterium sp. J1-1]
MKQDQFAQARGLSSAEVSDALDYFGLPGSAVGVRPVAGPRKLFGPAFTVRFGPVDTSQPGTVGDYLDEMPAGSVAVLDNAGRPDCTVWGGIMSQLAAHRAIAGTVVNGVCRDTQEADAAGYPLFALGRFMRTGKDRVQVDAVGGAVSVAGVRVSPGDIVVADQDGVVFVPAGRAAEVFERALIMQAVEARIVAAALDGMPLAQARREFGYHTLQRKPAQNA